MFSTSQQTICESLIPTYYLKGYKSYVCYTDTDVDYYRNTPDLYFVFSTDEISATTPYRYSVPQGSVRIAVRSANYNSGSGALNDARLKIEDFSGNLIIDDYEHIYSNAATSSTLIQPDILTQGVKTNENLHAQGIMLAVFFLFIVFWNFFRHR